MKDKVLIYTKFALSGINSSYDETFNRIISACSKLALEECNNRNGWVAKVIHQELCKRLKFDHTDESYMHKPENVRENETYKIIWDYETPPITQSRIEDQI